MSGVISIMPKFKIISEFKPTGDQPQAIEKLSDGIIKGLKHQVLLGVTGSGKTFTMANVIEKVQRPTLVIAHNKTLAAQLYNEFKELFPENAVEYFVSYYDYYQPEAYLPTTDTYIEKDSSINEEIDRMRHSATNSLFERNDVIVVASVSCIYGLGSPEAYHGMLLFLEQGQHIERNEILRKLVDIQYARNDFDFHRGTFRVRGDVVEIFPASYENTAIRIELFGDEIESISEFDPLLGTPLQKLEKVAIYPGQPLRDPRVAHEGGHRRHPRRAPGAHPAIPQDEQAHRGAAHRAAHHVRPRDDPGDGLLPRHRELLAPPLRTGARRAAADPARLLPEGLSPGRRRVPRHDPADRRHVQRRPGAEDDPRGIRLPPAFGAGQPAAQFRGVRTSGCTRPCMSRRRPPTYEVGKSGKTDHRAGDPAHGPYGPADRDQAGHGTGGRSA